VEEIGVKFMAENESTKVCSLCAETIKAAAKVCPHCRKIQKRWLFITRYDLAVLAMGFLAVGTVVWSVNMFSNGRNFSSSRDKVEVLSSQLVVDSSRENTNVIVSGILTNGSDYEWDMGNFEVRYLNNFGKIVDVDSGSDNFTVLPHSDHAFHLTLWSRKSIPEHASCKVFVRSAKDSSAWFPGD
jgi:hypothetical protein